MRLLFLTPIFATLLTAQPIQPLPLAEAENRYLDAWDMREGSRPIPVPQVASRNRSAMRWLTSAADQDLPSNPFPKGSKAWKEAESVRRFLQAPPEAWSTELTPLSLTLGGSHLAIWRWGQLKARRGLLDKPLRQQWEDKLLSAGGPAVIRGLALRHGFCFALGESDEARFGQLKDRHEDDFKELFPSFQTAFSLLGAPAPVVHLWTLPGLESVDLPLNKLGGPRVRFEPDPGAELPSLAEGTVWIIPTRDGAQPEDSTYLEGASLLEAQQLVPRLAAAKRTAFLAPVRRVFEVYALVYFPIQIEMEKDGTVRSIRMGDAALASPTPPPAGGR